MPTGAGDVRDLDDLVNDKDSHEGVNQLVTACTRGSQARVKHKLVIFLQNRNPGSPA